MKTKEYLKIKYACKSEFETLIKHYLEIGLQPNDLIIILERNIATVKLVFKLAKAFKA